MRWEVLTDRVVALLEGSLAGTHRALLFRWFVRLAIEQSVWNHSVFSKNRDRLIEHNAVTDLFKATEKMAEQRGLLSGKHFRVDTLI